MITADQLFLHALGDYIFQSHWMATEKTKQHWAAFCHALVYSLPFLALKPSLLAWIVIFVTHFFIDRYRLARYVVWLKNWLAPPMWWWKMSGDTAWRTGTVCWPGSTVSHSGAMLP